MDNDFLHFNKPTIDDEEINEVISTLKSGWITTGPKTRMFEEHFSEYVGAKYAVAVNSCTAGLHLALEAIGLKKDDEVITTTMTFAATAEVIEYFNAKPVFVDIDKDTSNINPELIENCITSKTRAIIPVHFAGLVCDMDRILSIASKHNLAVIEDAAHALPATCLSSNKRVGSIGDITAFSFYATKTITTGEGGMITTNNKDYADRMRTMSLHGMNKDAWNRYKQGGAWYYEIIKPGYKYNMTDIAAALGVVQLRKCDTFYRRRLELVQLYNNLLADVEELQTPSAIYDKSHAWHIYVIKLKLNKLKIDRSEFISLLNKAGIGVSVHFIPLHIHPYYKKTYNYKHDDFPVALDSYNCSITLPLYPNLHNNDISRIVESIKNIICTHRK